MPPIEDQENCILGICCNVPRRVHALAMRLANDLHLPDHKAAEIAEWINNNYDLAPKGLLDPLAQYYGALAREYPYQG